MMMNGKGFGSKRSWPNLMYYTGIRLEGMRKHRLAFPTLNKEHTDDKIWAEHLGKNRISGELNRIFLLYVKNTLL
jgi:hypothetical protein